MSVIHRNNKIPINKNKNLNYNKNNNKKTSYLTTITCNVKINKKQKQLQKTSHECFYYKNPTVWENCKGIGDLLIRKQSFLQQ